MKAKGVGLRLDVIERGWVVDGDVAARTKIVVKAIGFRKAAGVLGLSTKTLQQVAAGHAAQASTIRSLRTNLPTIEAIIAAGNRANSAA